MFEIKLLNNSLEDVTYNFPNLNMRLEKSSLLNYPNMACANHWHKDLEFLIPLKGKISYFVNGQNYSLNEGQAIFINSEQMHYGYSNDGSNCTFICILLPPSLIQHFDFISENYINKIFQDTNHPSFIFDCSIKWQKDFIDTLLNIYNLCENKKDGFELDVMSCIFSIYSMLYTNVRNDVIQKEGNFDKNINILHSMTGFIQKNYSKKITLKDIASSGNICRSSCCEIFKSVLNKSPIVYLTEYRLEKSLAMLNNPSFSITEIALKCGFSNSSYFTETFRKYLSYTPSEYRKNNLIKR